jgi:hypothetical protein
VHRSALAVLAAASLVLVFASSAVAASTITSDAKRARKGLAAAEKARWLKGDDAIVYRAALDRAVASVKQLPKLRRDVVAAQVNEVARQSGSYTSPRALALFSMLDTNLDYLETHVLPSGKVDINGDDGTVYRWFAQRGFQFHPLADFGALNAAVTGVDATQTQQLANALVARGIPRGKSLRWEYYFPFGSGQPPWLSGMAQAVAAQALARAGTMLGNPQLLDAARRAYAAVPGALTLELSQGPWIRLYAFSREVVLNAQLQTILSLTEYAQTTGDASASALAGRLTIATQTLFPRFDTGYWSLYELGGKEATLDYQQFVTQLLIKLAQRTGDPFWQDAATRFYAYIKQPPQMVPVPATTPTTLYPQPADKWLDTADVTFDLSKRSRVTLTVGAFSVTKTLDRGTATLTFAPGAKLPAGTYTGKLSAVDLAGNKSSVPLPQPYVIAVDGAPQVQAQLQNGVLAWQGVDPGTPKLKLVVTLVDANGAQQAIDLGFHSLTGTAPVTIPSGTWTVTLTATNTSGLATQVPLGQIAVP